MEEVQQQRGGKTGERREAYSGLKGAGEWLEWGIKQPWHARERNLQQHLLDIYATTMHNLDLDDVFFVTQFISRCFLFFMCPDIHAISTCITNMYICGYIIIHNDNHITKLC
ncbi:hypothetical protein ACJX0J_031505 [Zea mays]